MTQYQKMIDQMRNNRKIAQEIAVLLAERNVTMSDVDSILSHIPTFLTVSINHADANTEPQNDDSPMEVLTKLYNHSEPKTTRQYVGI